MSNMKYLEEIENLLYLLKYLRLSISKENDIKVIASYLSKDEYYVLNLYLYSFSLNYFVLEMYNCVFEKGINGPFAYRWEKHWKYEGKCCQMQISNGSKF